MQTLQQKPVACCLCDRTPAEGQSFALRTCDGCLDAVLNHPSGQPALPAPEEIHRSVQPEAA